MELRHSTAFIRLNVPQTEAPDNIISTWTVMFGNQLHLQAIANTYWHQWQCLLQVNGIFCCHSWTNIQATFQHYSVNFPTSTTQRRGRFYNFRLQHSHWHALTYRRSYFVHNNTRSSTTCAINILHRYGRDQIHPVASIDGKRSHPFRPDESNRR